MSKKYYSIEAKSGNEADVFIYDVIGESFFEEGVTAKKFVKDFKDLESRYSRINVRINSPGGSVFEGLAIFNAIYQSKVETHTYNDGLAASMGAMILFSGKTIHAAKNALTMLHSPMGIGIGTAKDMRDLADVLDKIEGSLRTAIVDRTGLTDEQVKNKFFDYEDHWFSAEEAKEEKLIDEIEDRESKAPKDMKGMSLQEMIASFDSNFRFEEQQKANLETRFFAWLTDIFNKNQTAQTEKTENSEEMKDAQRFIKALGLEGLKAKDEEAEDRIFEAVQNLVQAKTDAESQLQEASELRQTAENRLSEANKALDAVDESVANAEKIEDKVTAITTMVDEMRENPGESPKDLNAKGENNSPDEDPCTVKEGDDFTSAMKKIREEFGIGENQES